MGDRMGAGGTGCAIHEDGVSAVGCDSGQSLPAREICMLPAIWRAFEDGGQILSCFGPVSVQCRDAGPLTLPSGRIVACDPGLGFLERPFSIAVEPDTYPVLLAEADERVACAMISFAEGIPVRWVRASPRHGDPHYCFDVDTAKACFLDVIVAQKLRHSIDRGGFEPFEREIDAQMAGTGFANVLVRPDNNGNLVAFSSGAGDCAYASSFGLAPDGSPICLITDFRLLEDEQEPEAQQDHAC